MKKNTKKNNQHAADKRRKRPAVIVVICLAVLILLGGLACGYIYLSQGLPGNTILENVSVAGVDVGGMTKLEAISAIRQAVLDSYEKEPMVVQVDSRTVSLSPELTGASFDVYNAVDLAYNYGRSEDPSENAITQIQAATSGIDVDILSCLNLNTDAIATELQGLMEKFSSKLTQPSYIISGADGVDKTLIVTMGTPGYGLTYESLYEQVLAAYNTCNFSLTVSSQLTEPEAVDLEAIHKETYIEPVNATYDAEAKGTTAHTLGYSFDVENAKTLIEGAKYGENVSIPYVCTEPEVTQKALEEMLFRDVLSTYTAKSSSTWGRDTNLDLACKAVNGVVLQPGETFDYNKTLGERTAEKGYKYGAAYVGNKTISTIGGGICQVSSTVYYCALMADMEIVTRINHGYLNSYIPMGMDATVSWGGPEFRFKNNSDYPIRIEASASGGHTTVTLYGTDVKDYYVKMEYEVLATYPWSKVEQEMKADNPDGYKDGDVISTAYTGYKVATYRCKYNKETNELISREQEAINVYSKRDYVICKIVSEDTVPPTTQAPTVPTTPPETETTAPPETPTETEPVVPDGPITEDG